MAWLGRVSMLWLAVVGALGCVLLTGVSGQADGGGDCALEDVEEEIR